MNRREFTRELMAGALAGPVALGKDGNAAAPQEPVSTAVEDQLLVMLRTQYGDRLSEEQWKQVRGKISGQLSAAKSLREFKLQNSDEPATVFRV